MTMLETPPAPAPAPAPAPTEPRATGLRPTFYLTLVVLVLCGLVVGVGPMILRSPSGVKVPAGATRVNVALFDFGIRLDSSTTVHPGRNAFVITNTGHIAHELVGFQTSVPSGRLPRRADGGVNEESPLLHSVLDTGASLPPGTTKVVVVDLKAGSHYVFVCNLPGHWQSGMHIDVTP